MLVFPSPPWGKINPKGNLFQTYLKKVELGKKPGKSKGQN